MDGRAQWQVTPKNLQELISAQARELLPEVTFAALQFRHAIE